MTAGSGRLLTLAILAGAAVLYGGRLGGRALWSEEVRWAEIPREMVRTGDYLWPTINAHTYYDKPLGSYWLVLAAAAVTGGVDELAARLPSAAAGVLAVGLVMALARRFGADARQAALAGGVLATSYGYVFFARTASTDVETIAGVLGALWAGTGAKDGERWSAPRTFAFWVVMAITSLTKGLLGFALPLLILGCFHTFAAEATPRAPGVTGGLVACLRRNRWLLNPWTVPAAVLAVAVYAGPFALSIRQTGNAEGLGMVWRENVRRFFDAHNHRGPVYLYLYVLPGLLAPWALFLPAGLLRAHATRDRLDRFALAFFWGVFIFFTLSSSRRSYYLLPILPAAAVLVARVLLTETTALGVWTRRLRTGGFVLTAAAVVPAGLAAVVPPSVLGGEWAGLPALPAPELFVAGWLASVAAVGFALWRCTPARLASSAAVISVWGIGYAYLAALPELEAYRTARPFLAHVREATADRPTAVALYRTREAVWYLDPGAELPECGSAADLAGRLDAREVRWGLLKAQDLGQAAGRLRVVMREPAHPWEGPEVRGKKLVLVERAGSAEAAGAE